MDKIIKHRLVSGGLWVAGGKIFSFISQLALNAFLARLLAPDDMGLYFLIFSLVHFFTIFSLLGMQRSIVRIVSESLALEQAERARQAVIYMLQFGILSSVIVAILLVSGTGQFISKHVFGSAVMSNIIYFPAIWLVICTLQSLIAESYRGYHDIRFATIFNGLVSNVISATVLGFILWTNKTVDIRLVLLIIITSYAINLIFAFSFLLMHTGKLTKPNDRLISRSDLMRSSWLLYSTNIVLFVMTFGHLWLLAYYSTKENVAIYGAVSRLMILITTTLAMLRHTILPTIGHLYTKKLYSDVEKVLRTTATIAGMPAIIGFLLIILMGKNILSLIYGDHYTAGYSALLILSVANLINVFTGTPSPLMVMASKEKFLLIFILISSSIGMILSVSLVGSMEFLGVSIGAGTGIVLYNVLMVWYCKKQLSINTLMSFREISNLALRTRYGYAKFAQSAGFRKLFKS